MLLDTCIIIDILRGNASAHGFVRALPRQPHVAPMTLTELHAGFLNQWEERMAAGLLATFKMLEMSDSAIFQRAGIFMRHYRASHNIDVADALIAATAEHHGVQFATLNVKHFPMFPRLRRAY